MLAMLAGPPGLALLSDDAVTIFTEAEVGSPSGDPVLLDLETEAS